MQKLKELLSEKAQPPNIKKWWEETPEDLMNYAYWLKSQMPPTNKSQWDASWKSLKKQLEKKYPRR